MTFCPICNGDIKMYNNHFSCKNIICEFNMLDENERSYDPFEVENIEEEFSMRDIIEYYMIRKETL